MDQNLSNLDLKLLTDLPDATHDDDDNNDDDNDDDVGDGDDNDLIMSLKSLFHHKMVARNKIIMHV